MQYSIVQYSTVQYSTAQYSAVPQYSAVQYSKDSTVRYSTVRYSTVYSTDRRYEDSQKSNSAWKYIFKSPTIESDRYLPKEHSK